MTAAGALDAIAARLVAAGLSEARSPLGVRNEAAGRVDRCFSVRPKSTTPPGLRGKDRHRIALVFTVEMGHRLKPSDGADAPDTALADYERALKYIATPATSLTTDAAIGFGGAVWTYAGGGAFLITAFDLTVSYTLDLSL